MHFLGVFIVVMFGKYICMYSTWLCGVSFIGQESEFFYVLLMIVFCFVLRDVMSCNE